MSPEPVLVIHSTEGRSLRSAVETLERNNTRSHVVFDPATGERAQLVEYSEHARSLANKAGGVQTNRRGEVYQIEVVGFARLVPGYDDRWYKALAAEIVDICDELNIPKRFPKKFIEYKEHPPSSYGKNNGVRMTAQEWNNATGIIGHMHVPENVHGDPGDISRLIELVAPGFVPPPLPQDSFIKELQQRLKDAKLYHGAIDGIWGRKSTAALDQLLAIPETLETQSSQLASLTADLAQTRAELDQARGNVTTTGSLSLDDARALVLGDMVDQIVAAVKQGSN